MPESIPHQVQTGATSPSSTSPSTSPSSPPAHLGLLRRLSESIPEHAHHLFDRVFAPNTVLYTPPKNDPHDSDPSSPVIEDPSSTDHEEGTRMWRRRRSSVGKAKYAERHVEVVEVNGCQMVGEETERPSEEYGVPLCREAEIEKWKCQKDIAAKQEGPRRRRRSMFAGRHEE